MMRRGSIALVSLAAIAVGVPSAQAYTYSSSHRFFQQRAADPSGASIILNVEYAKRSPNGKSTPRKVYLQFAALVNCQVGGTTTAVVASGRFKFQYQRVEFSGSFTNQFAPASNPTPGANGTDYATGHLVKKKNRKKWRMNGTVRVIAHNSPPTFMNCSNGEIPYSATRCSWTASAASAPPCTNVYSPP
jgi:hypothetical protein